MGERFSTMRPVLHPVERIRFVPDRHSSSVSIAVSAFIFRRCTPRRHIFHVALLALATSTGGCALGPDYLRPPAPVPHVYKELKGWKIATPRDAIDRGAWWSIYKDPELDRLERQVAISNQNVAAAEAAFRQSVALVQEARAGLFPIIGVNYNAVRSHQGSAAGGEGSSGGFGGSGGITQTTVTMETTASWDLDVWGRIRRTIESNAANAQVSAADLANAKLSAQAQLATAYFNLRAADSLQTLLNKTVEEFRRTETITENEYKQGTVGRSDVLTAQTQVKTTEAEAINVGVERAEFEHAIAVLIGVPPSALAIRASKLATDIPAPSPDSPASLLERRPDISAAERGIEAQSALIGVDAAAYFPDISLSGFIGWVGSTAFPISVANEVWQIGATVSETLFDGGARRAQLTATEAAYYQAMALYRQAVLTGFQEVEDNLSALRILSRQQKVQDEAVKLSREAVSIALNEYKAGTVSFTTVVTAQATQLANEQTALTVAGGIRAICRRWPNSGMLAPASAFAMRSAAPSAQKCLLVFDGRLSEFRGASV
jgi:NodT family efflux transporter outer membrane factor (OMF) lipoprotein